MRANAVVVVARRVDDLLAEPALIRPSPSHEGVSLKTGGAFGVQATPLPA